MSKFISTVKMINRITTSSQDYTPSTWVRAGWYLAVILSLVITIAAIPGYIQAVPQGFSVTPFAINPSPVVVAINALSALFSVATVLLSIYLAFLLFRRRPHDRMVVFLSFYLLIFGILTGPFEFLGRAVAGRFTSFVWNLNVILFQVVLFTASSFLFVLFPDGRFAPGWSRRVALASLVTSPIMVFGFLIWYHTDPRPLAALVIASIPPVLVMIGVLYAQFYRFRRLASGEQKQQIKWVVYGLGIMLFIQITTAFPYFWSFTLPPDTPYPVWLALSTALYFLSFTALPVSLTIAVMRHRLYDIDILINRTLVYGALTACIVGLYVLIVGAASTALLASNQLAGFLIATVLVGVFFQPLRTLLQQGADRLMGRKDVDLSRSAEELSDRAQMNDTDTAPASLTGAWRLITRVGWYLVAAAALGILIASIPGYLSILRNGFITSSFAVPPSFLNSALNAAYVVLSFSAALMSLGIAWVLFRNKPTERMAVFLSFYLLAYGVWFPGPLLVLAPIWPKLAANIFLIMAGFIGPPTMILFVTFPDGKFVPRWTRWLVLGSIPVIPLNLITSGNSLPFPWSRLISLVVWGLGLGLSLGALYAQFYRFRKVSNLIERQQTKWVVYGSSLWFLIFLVIGTINERMQVNSSDSLSALWMQINGLVWVISTIILPIYLYIAVARYRLYDIDIIINRTLVYGALTAATMGIYVVAVGYLGNLFQTQDKSLIAFLTTGLVALLFQPLRERLQGVVNRLIYGERNDPVSVLTKLGKKLEETVSPQEAISEIVGMIAKTLKLPYVAIEYGVDKKAQVIASFGQAPAETVQYPILFQAKPIGCLVVAPRFPGEVFNQKDKILLENIARQAGTAAQTAKFTADLQRSRQRLVAAREEERRRLRRDLHDGIGPTMAGQTLKLDAAIDLILGDTEAGLEPDLDEAIKMLTELKTQTQATVKNIRHIVYALRPPSLDDLGLAAAIQAHVDQLSVSKQGLRITIHKFPHEMPRLPAAVELAAYRIVLEALTNVINHAQAQECRVHIRVSESEPRELSLEITDDGIGFSEDRSMGIGLTSMRERAEEIGGSFSIETRENKGTRVYASIPLGTMEQ